MNPLSLESSPTKNPYNTPASRKSIVCLHPFLMIPERRKVAEAAGQWGTALNTGLLGTVGLESHQEREC